MSRTTNYFALFSLLVLGLSPAKAQEPDVDPSGNAGALKAQVETGGSYSPYSGNASRSVTDMQVPGAVGDGLAFTRHWNSTEEGAGKPFATGGWTHSWNWYAERDLEEYVANEEEYPRWAGITFGRPNPGVLYPAQRPRLPRWRDRVAARPMARKLGLRARLGRSCGRNGQ